MDFRAVGATTDTCDGSAVVGERSFVVLVDIVVIEEVEIAIGCLFSVHLFEFVAEQAAVQSNEVAFGYFADEGGEILVLDIGICIEL